MAMAAAVCCQEVVTGEEVAPMTRSREDINLFIEVIIFAKNGVSVSELIILCTSLSCSLSRVLKIKTERIIEGERERVLIRVLKGKWGVCCLVS